MDGLTLATPVFDRLSALSDATRARLLLVIEQHELSVGELCAALELPQSTISRHLKVLSEDGWVTNREAATSRFYTIAPSLDAAARDLWAVVRAEIAETPIATRDLRGAERAIARRKSKARQFFSSATEEWDRLRADLVGDRLDLVALLELLDDRWVVGDLGCGAGHVAALLAPCVARVVAVDESAPMLESAARRLSSFDNVDLREGSVESLPIENGSLDIALLFLVTRFVADPAQSMREAHRVLRPGGRLVVVDLVRHDRDDLPSELGAIWPGFDRDEVTQWLTAAGFTAVRYRSLPAEPRASAPEMFAASARRAT